MDQVAPGWVRRADRCRNRRHQRVRMLVVVLAVLLAMSVPGPVGAAEPDSSSTVPPTVTTTTSTTTPTNDSTTSTTSTSVVPSESSTTSTSAAPGPLTPPATLPRQTIDALRALTDDYESATADEIDVLRRFLLAQQQVIDLSDRVDALNASLDTVKGDLSRAEDEVSRADAEVAAADARLADTEDLLTQEQDLLRDQAVESYIGGGPGGGNASSNAVLRAPTMNDLGKSMVYASAIVVDQQTAIDRVTATRAEVEQRRVDADLAREQAVAARDAVAAQQSRVTAQRDQQEATRAQTQTAALEQADLLKQVAEKRDAYAARIAVLTRVSDGISETLRRAEEGQSLPLITAGIFLSPLPNPVFNSPFGSRADPFLGTTKVHNGVDMNGTTGTPIRAPADGVVLIAGEVSGYGNCTVIDHGSGLGTLYGHQSRFNVQVGDIVTRGQVIGFVGSTGNSTGPHLHWEVRKFGQPTDPVPFIGPG